MTFTNAATTCSGEHAYVPLYHMDSQPNPSFGALRDFPPEILLHILSYLDLPDLAVIERVVPELAALTSDPVLHRYRLLTVSPSRVSHNLFGKGPLGDALRPTIPDLVHRGVLRGNAIERQWRMGAYIYSKNSVVQYENGRELSRRLASNVLSGQLRRRMAPGGLLETLYSRHVYPDEESSSPNVARSLLPIMRKLKWSLQRDRLAKVFNDSGVRFGIAAWLANGDLARRVLREDEKTRLAVCPGIRKARGFFEELSRS